MEPVGDWLLRQGGGASAPPPSTLTRLRRDGLNIVDGAGIWKYRGLTGFRAPELFLFGERGWLEDYYGAARELGVTALRVFSVWNNTKYGPVRYGGAYYDQYPRWLEHLHSFGLRAHIVGECDQKPSNPDVYFSLDQGKEHHRRLREFVELLGGLDLYEISNEDTDGDSGQRAQHYPASLFAGMLTTRSTWAGDEDPQKPGTWLDWSTYHTPRVPNFPIKERVLQEIQQESLGNYPAPHIPAISGEPIRIAEGTSARDHADAASVAELYGAGRCLHGGFSSFDGNHQSDLQNCRMPGPGLALDCMLAVSWVWKSGVFDLRTPANGRFVRGQQNGQGECPIVHRDKADDPQRGAERSYFHELDGVMYGLAVQPGPQWQLETREGWRLANRGGFQDNQLKLVR